MRFFGKFWYKWENWENWDIYKWEFENLWVWSQFSHMDPPPWHTSASLPPALILVQHNTITECTIIEWILFYRDLNIAATMIYVMALILKVMSAIIINYVPVNLINRMYGHDRDWPSSKYMTWLEYDENLNEIGWSHWYCRYESIKKVMIVTCIWKYCALWEVLTIGGVGY